MFVRVGDLSDFESCAVFDVQPRKTPSTAEPPRTKSLGEVFPCQEPQVREPSRERERERERERWP